MGSGKKGVGPSFLALWFAQDGDVPVHGLVDIAQVHDHAVEGIHGEAAGVALQQASGHEPVGVREGELGATVVLLHGGAAAVFAHLVLTV